MGLAERVKNEYPSYDVRVSILGHLQRGGSPTAHDRILASRMGAAAIDALMEDQRNVMIGIKNDEIVYVPFSKAIKTTNLSTESFSTPCAVFQYSRLRVVLRGSRRFLVKNKALCFGDCKILSNFAVASQSGCSTVGSAPRSGRGGRKFESSHPDNFSANGFSSMSLDPFR